MSWLRRKAGALPLAAWAFIGLVVALIPAAIVQITLEREVRHERTQQLGEQALRFVRLVGQQQSSMIEAARQVISTVAAYDAVRALRPSAECDAFLARIVSANPRYVTASVFDRQGNSICLAHEATRSLNVADRGYFQRAMQENSFQIGGYAIGRASGQRSLHVAAPVQDEAGQPVALVLLALSLDWMNSELQRIPLPAGSAATLADRDGIVLARSAEAERFIGQVVPPFVRAWLNAPAPGVEDVISMDGMRRIAAYLPLTEEPAGLFVAVGLEITEALGAAVDADRRAAVMIIGSLLLTVLLAILMFHSAVERPVRRLLSVARNWEAQDWGARVGAIGGGREFRKLAEAFDTMADSATQREAARLRAQTRMQAVVAVAPQIVLTADHHGQVDWANPYWEEMTGLSLAESRGDGWLAAVHPEDRAAAATAWQTALASEALGKLPPFSHEMRICHADTAEWRWFFFTGALIRMAAGQPSAWTLVGLDNHERRQAEEARAESAARLRATYESAPVGLCLMDRELRFIAVNDMLAETNSQTAAAHLGQPLAAMAPHLAERIEPVMRQVLETGQPVEALELSGSVQGEERFWLCSYFPVRGVDGSVTGVSAAIVDITTRKRVEASERLLSREVDHRAQNVLSVVRGLVRLSAAEVQDDVPALIEVLEGRIAALSRVHNLLAQERWVSAELEQILRQELESVREKVTLDGPPLRIAAEAAQPFALVVHELLTNSVKYGALSSPSGRLILRWRVRQAQVALEWIERGGPEILAEPRRVGLGSLLIEANAGAQLAGRMERQWLRGGLHATLTMGETAFVGELGPAMPWREPGLAGRRVLLADDDPARAAALVSALREDGCELLGPAASLEAALALLDEAGTVDAAVLPATLQGVSAQLLWQALDRRAAVTLRLPGKGDLPAMDRPADVLPEPGTAQAVRQALAAALGRNRQMA